MLADEFGGIVEKEKAQRTSIDFERVERIRQKSDEMGFEKKFVEHYGHTMWKLGWLPYETLKIGSAKMFLDK